MYFKMTTEEHMQEKMKEFASNIDEFEVGCMVKDSKGVTCQVLEKTLNSICVSIKIKTERGLVDGCQWFDMRRFNDRFKKV